MDYPLGVSLHLWSLTFSQVLIPILMDYPLGEPQRVPCRTIPERLNPYSNGLPSRGGNGSTFGGNREDVLIPILMDYPLGADFANRLTFQITES